MGATGTAPARPTLKRPAKNAAVKRLQQALRDAGFDPGPVDGSFGKRTQAAVERLQKAAGIKVDGIVGPKTWAALDGAAPATSAAPRPAAAPKARQLSPQGLELIAGFEGFRSDLHNDPAGHASIGFGHLVHRGRINGSEPAEFRRGISRNRALELLRRDVAVAEEVVNQAVTVPLAPHQFDALVSFVFNVGGGAFRKSTLLKKINAGDHAAVRSELARWSKGGGKVLPGLVRRRKEEADLYERGTTKGGRSGPSGVALPGTSISAATAAQVRVTQELLNRNGFPCGRADGKLGPKTTAAVRRFQASYAGGPGQAPVLVRDGVLGPRTVAAAAELPRLSPHFTVSEFASRGDGTCYVRCELVEALERLRAALGKRSLTIRSGYRDPAHNKKVGGATNSMHMFGLAADLELPCTVEEARRLKLFSGIGEKNGRVRHVDLRHLSENNKTPAATPSSPALWAY